MKYSGIILLTMMSAVFCVQAGVAEPQRSPQEQRRLNISLEAHARAYPLPDIESLVQQGADVHATGFRGFSALHMAGSGGNCAVGKYLVERESNIHALTDGGWSALHCAAQGGSLGLVQFLVERGADIYALTGKDQSVIYCVARGGRYDNQAKKKERSEIIQFLLQKGATIAPKDDKMRIVNVLLKATEDVSPEQFVALCDRPETLFTPEHDQLNETQKNNLLRYAALAGKDGLVTALLANGIKVNESSVLSLSPQACAVIGTLQPQTFDRIPEQGVYGEDERVYALAKKHGYHYGKNKLMTLFSIAIAAVIRLIAN